ncbi:MAG: LysM peptidoglycan-binding domain-containing protein [Lentisphaerae bacterium]|nr:LysM peptidoglycan-binding domain-containing protein [Lentisphaerota bacterium]
MNDLNTSDSAAHGPGMTNLLIIALAAVAIVVGAVALVAGLNARKAVDALRADIEVQGATVATADQNLRNLTGQSDRLFRQVGEQFTGVNSRLNEMAGRIATLTAPPKPAAPVAGLAPAGAAPVAGVQKAAAPGGAAAAAPAAPSGKTHKIESGDNFGKIAKKYGISVAALEKANPNVNPSKLKIGQAISLP